MKLIKKHGRAVKTIFFLLAAILILGICNFIFTPVWMDWNNYSTTHGFYEEPKDTIETVFLGTSSVTNGVIPTKLYEDYGICAYNLATEQQPMLASYYWLEEAYRFHSETLDTVVLDISSLRIEAEEADYHKALDAMHFSEIKLQAVRSYSEGWEETFQNLIPLLSYHSRWGDLSEEDILKAGYKPELSFRGYNFDTDKRIDSVDSYSEILMPLYEADENAGEMGMNEEALYYFDKIAEFCEENGIQLLLIRVPSSWSSEAHNGAQKIADTYGLEFLDLNINPYFDEAGYNFATETKDRFYHLNYWGALKVTSFLGQYLSENYGNRDVRGDTSYQFMEDELEEFHRLTAAADFSEFTDPCDYLSYALGQEDYTIFISVRNDAAGKLTEEQREFFSSSGLKQLAELSKLDSYLAVIDGGEVLAEESESDSEGEEGTPLSAEGVLQDGTSYSVSSGGRNFGNTSSVLIDNEEFSINKRGLNIVVYDKQCGKVVDAANFDTHSTSVRSDQDYEKHLQEEINSGVSYAELSGTDRILYQYDRACENDKILKNVQKEIGEDGLISYLEIFSGINGMDIYLSVKGETDACLTADVCAALKELGLEELSQIENQDSYLAMIRDGNVEFEERESKGTPLENRSEQAVLVSDGSDTGGISSVVIDGEEFSMNERGINIVVYDSILETVVDSAVFDTFSVEPAL